MASEPQYVAWADQFGALLRDKCRQMQAAVVATGWDTLAHGFVDPADGDLWRLEYNSGTYIIRNVTEGEDGKGAILDIEALGVNR